MPNDLSWSYRCYLGFSRISEPLWRLALRKRVKSGKEDLARVEEKLGSSKLERPSGPLLWFHALSVGESLALLPLFDKILTEHPYLTLLLTSSTRSSADALRKQNLPDQVVHQMLPVDATGPINRFLDHWQPSAAIMSELDLWPALLANIRGRNIPNALINCRISDKNFAKRQRGKAMFRDILAGFDPVLVQDQETAKRFAFFGIPEGRVSVLGALKGAPRPLAADEIMLDELRREIGTRPVWLAASTEAREEEAIAKAHKTLLKKHPEALLILAPRHPKLVKETRRILDEDGLEVAQRSLGDRVTDGTQVYLADTIGEMGLWYRLAPVTFMGHSLPVSGDRLRGKNPFEAAVLGTAILHGPDVVDFSETYELMDQNRAALQTDDATTLASTISKLFEQKNRVEIIENTKKVLEQTAQVLDQTYEKILPLIPKSEN